MQNNWSKSFVCSALYAVLVIGGQHYIRLRPEIKLQLPLILLAYALVFKAPELGSIAFVVLASMLEYHWMQHSGNCPDRLGNIT